MRRPLLICLAALTAFAFLAGAASAASLGIVLLHGKSGTPAQFARLGAALTAAGFVVSTPEMCWSKTRIFDKAFPDCLKEVDAAVADLRKQGATAVVVGGMSEGAVAAIDYGATRKGLAGIVALAPAADPPQPGKYPEFDAAIVAAQAAVKKRQGNVAQPFDDLVNGAIVTVNATPSVFLSFHDPKGSVATIRAIKAKVLPKLTVPLLWVAGHSDLTQASTRAVFAAAPDNKLSAYDEIAADHPGTPDAAAPVVIDWLKTLGP